MRSHHKQRLVPLLMRWSKTRAHICTIRATWTWLRRLFLGAQGSCNLQLPQFWLNILIHPTLTPPFPRHYVFTTSSLVLKCIVCIVLCVFGCVRFWIKAAVARICSFYLHPSYKNCVFGLHPKIHESIFGQFLWRQNFSSMGVVVFIIGQLSLYPVTTFQDFIDFICLRSPNTFLSYLIMVESESNKD